MPKSLNLFMNIRGFDGYEINQNGDLYNYYVDVKCNKNNDRTYTINGNEYPIQDLINLAFDKKNYKQKKDK